MVDPLRFDALVQAFHRLLDHLPDTRRGNHLTSTLKDAVLGAFAVFLPNRPPFSPISRPFATPKGPVMPSTYSEWLTFRVIPSAAPC